MGTLLSEIYRERLRAAEESAAKAVRDAMSDLLAKVQASRKMTKAASSGALGKAIDRVNAALDQAVAAGLSKEEADQARLTIAKAMARELGGYGNSPSVVGITESGQTSPPGSTSYRDMTEETLRAAINAGTGMEIDRLNEEIARNIAMGYPKATIDQLRIQLAVAVARQGYSQETTPTRPHDGPSTSPVQDAIHPKTGH